VDRRWLPALPAGTRLSPRQIGQLEAILELLEADVHAPTAVRDGPRAAYVHLADSLAAVDLEVVGSARRIADLGSGAGFPGLVLAVALPEADVRLLESQRRRCEFLRRACDAAELGNAEVMWGRVEEWKEGIAGNDLVTARALAPQPVALEYAAPLLRLGGSFVDWRGRRNPAEEDLAGRVAGQLGLERSAILPVGPFAGADEHHLHVFAKVEETPERFPRRAGIARKRPLGS